MDPRAGMNLLEQIKSLKFSLWQNTMFLYATARGTCSIITSRCCKVHVQCS